MALKAHSRRRGLFVTLSAFFLFAALLAADAALAKNPYDMHDSSTEGDPGDGVLRPVPEIEPTPQPAPREFGLVFTLDTLGDYRYDLPLVLLLPVTDASGLPVSMSRDRYSILLPEGRYQDAP
jgi:hypothetical protein